VLLSAASGVGIEALEARIGAMLTARAKEVTVTLPVSDGRRMAWLHAHGDVLGEEDAGEGENGPMKRVTVRLNPKELGQYETLEN
jgi:GTP-binding protein HflX